MNTANLDLDELERLLTEAHDAYYKKGLIDWPTIHKNNSLLLAALPALIAAARERDALKAELEIASSFYKVVLAERNYERAQNDRLAADNERLRELLAQRENEIDDLHLAAGTSPAVTGKP